MCILTLQIKIERSKSLLGRTSRIAPKPATKKLENEETKIA